MSNIREAIERSTYAEVAHLRTDLGADIWDIISPDEWTTIRVAADDETIVLYVFTGAKAMVNAGEMHFRGALATPDYVAAALDQIVTDYSAGFR